MLVKMEYQDIGVAGLKTNYDSKVKTHYIDYIVDEYTIDTAIQEVNEGFNKYTVCLQYEGDLQRLFMIDEKPKCPVLVKRELEDVTELAITFLVKMVPDWVRLCIKTPSDFSDMRLVESISKKYPNVHFCGGKLLRLKSCNVGCLRRDEIPKKISDQKFNFYVEGCACPLRCKPVEELEGVDIIIKDKYEHKKVKKEEVKEQIKEEVTSKKVISNLSDLFDGVI